LSLFHDDYSHLYFHYLKGFHSYKHNLHNKMKGIVFFIIYSFKRKTPLSS